MQFHWLVLKFVGVWSILLLKFLVFNISKMILQFFFFSFFLFISFFFFFFFFFVSFSFLFLFVSFYKLRIIFEIEQSAIEAKYVFPLDEFAAVCGFEAFINGKHIIGKVKEKEQVFFLFSFCSFCSF